MLSRDFYAKNRQALYEKLPARSVAVFFAGTAPRQSADAYYPFYVNRNFLYLTGMEEERLILLAVKGDGPAEEAIYLQREDPMQERWFGRRIHAGEAREVYGFQDCRQAEDFSADLTALIQRGALDSLWLDFDRETPEEPGGPAEDLARQLQEQAPYLTLCNAHPLLRDLRTLKRPQEIDAMRRAVPITRAGIEAMMRSTRPGMKEYQLKAEFDYALARRGVLTPAFPSIVCAGENNFCIHYYDYTGEIRDGDMVLCDVGAWQDGLCNDVSRTWPVNGTFNPRQRALYQAIYDTSEHMFSIIRPGMEMGSVDELARRFCFERLKALGLLEDFGDIRRLMWHDGAHHVGFDVHDVVNYSWRTAPGMVFCVDIGVYCQEWGIGFRLEDNCLVTETGCENLTASIPRSIEDIEALLAQRTL